MLSTHLDSSKRSSYSVPIFCGAASSSCGYADAIIPSVFPIERFSSPRLKASPSPRTILPLKVPRPVTVSDEVSVLSVMTDGAWRDSWHSNSRVEMSCMIPEVISINKDSADTNTRLRKKDQGLYEGDLLPRYLRMRCCLDTQTSSLHIISSFEWVANEGCWFEELGFERIYVVFCARGHILVPSDRHPMVISLLDTCQCHSTTPR